jgi:Uma2 family endonuclease
MATTKSIAYPEQRVILHNISWETYERLLADHEQSSAPRFTYDRGELEIMSPLPAHETVKWDIAAVVENAAESFGIEFLNLGSTTFKREDLERGFEADSCFYFQNEPAVRGKDRLDLTVDPPPDLVIEIDLTHSSLPKHSVFAALGVPEVWRHDGQRLMFLALEGDRYAEVASSRALPRVTVQAVNQLVAASRESSRLAWLRSVRDWARTLDQ